MLGKARGIIEGGAFEAQKDYLKKHPEHKLFNPRMVPLGLAMIAAGGVLFFIMIRYNLKGLVFPITILLVFVFSRLAKAKFKSMD